MGDDRESGHGCGSVSPGRREASYTLSVSSSVYIETTIPSYYATTRTGMDRDVERTREWWERERTQYHCFISPVVIDELSEGDYPTKVACLRLIDTLDVLAVREEVVDIALAYQTAKVMPAPPIRDALHVALACFYRMDYLLTWNCRHIANAAKYRHLQVINARLGLATPQIITPHMLRLEGD